MTYLHGQKFVHRDIAARNLLVSIELEEKKIVKVADFGLTVTQPQTSSEMIAVRWAAPEVLTKSQFSFGSDVYSFAMTMVEIFTSAQIPYFALTTTEVLEQVPKGLRPPCPVDCPKNVFEMMEMCWVEDSEKRLNFIEISKKLEQLKESSTDVVAKEV